MKRLLFPALVLIFAGNVSGAFWDKWRSLLPEINGIKVETAKNADALAKFQADIKAEIGDIRAEVKANAAAQAQAVAGVNNKVDSTSTQIGEMRDNISNVSNVNDTGLMTEIFKGLFALMSAICVGLFTALKAKEKHIQALIISNEKKQTKQDEWERATIDSMLKKEGVRKHE